MKPIILIISILASLGSAKVASADQKGSFIIGCKSPKDRYAPGWYDANSRSIPQIHIGALDKRSKAMNGRIFGAKAIFGGALTEDEIYISVPISYSSGENLEFSVFRQGETFKLGTLFLTRADSASYSGSFVAEKNLTQAEGLGQFNVYGCVVSDDESDTGGYRPGDL